MHLKSLGRVASRRIRAAGGVPFEFNTIAVCDGIAMGHARHEVFPAQPRAHRRLPWRRWSEAHCFDGMVCIPNCDKIVPGMLMARLRVNIPAIFVCGGPMPAGRTTDGKAVDLITVFEAVGATQAGQDRAKRSCTSLEAAACPACGSCSGMFTANP